LSQSIAFAEMTLAERYVENREDARAEDLYHKAIDRLSEAWQLLDSGNFYEFNLAAAEHNLAETIIAASEANPAELQESLRHFQNGIRTYEQLLQQEVTSKAPG